MTDDFPEGWEDWLAFFGAQLPAPVKRFESGSGTLTFVAGDPPEVVVRLTHRAIRVAEVHRLSRRDAARVVHYRWVGRIAWRWLPGRHSVKMVEQLVAAARQGRLGRYGACFVCGRRLPPEWMADADTCRRCVKRGGVSATVH
jgi:hypothetical protein